MEQKSSLKYTKLEKAQIHKPVYVLWGGSVLKNVWLHGG